MYRVGFSTACSSKNGIYDISILAELPSMNTRAFLLFSSHASSQLNHHRPNVIQCVFPECIYFLLPALNVHDLEDLRKETDLKQPDDKETRIHLDTFCRDAERLAIEYSGPLFTFIKIQQPERRT